MLGDASSTSRFKTIGGQTIAFWLSTLAVLVPQGTVLVLAVLGWLDSACSSITVAVMVAAAAVVLLLLLLVVVISLLHA